MTSSWSRTRLRAAASSAARARRSSRSSSVKSRPDLFGPTKIAAARTGLAERQGQDGLESGAPEPVDLQGLLPAAGSGQHGGERFVVDPEPQGGPGLPVALGRDEGADLLHGQRLVERPGEERQEVGSAVGLPGRRREAEEGPAVVVALPEEGPVDEDLDPGPGRGEDHGRDERRSDRDPAAAGPGAGGEERLEPLDREQIDPDGDRGQQRIDDAAVDDDLDVEAACT